MKTVFADTAYWVAVVNPRDDLHEKAIQVSQSLGNHRIVISEMVLAEFLNTFSKYGDALRGAAVNLIKKLKDDPNTKIVPQTSMQFNEALNFFADRPDKEWSLTDCASFKIMETENIREALSHDRHFLQAGLIALLRTQE